MALSSPSLPQQPTAHVLTRWITAYQNSTLALRLSFWLHIGVLIGVVLAPAYWPWFLGLLIINHALLTGAVLTPRGRLLGPNLLHLPTAAAQRGEVALTFDDGPDPEVTPQVLDLLDRYGAQASFFCIGERAAQHPKIIQDIIRRGHSVENHTHRHPHAFACFTPAMLRREISAASAAIEAAAGSRPHFFRAPMGFRSPFLDAAMHATGLRYAAWTRRGFDAVKDDADEISRRLLDGLAAGDILLLHDGLSGKRGPGYPVVLAVLPMLLTALRDQGLRAVSMRTAFAEP